MSDFFCAYHDTMTYEGTYSNDPRDRGGETWRGISRTNHPEWEGWPVVDTVKRSVLPNSLANALNADDELDQMVRDFYELAYWAPLQCDQIKEQAIAAELFDTAINQGQVIATKQLQEALNLLNNNQKHYSDIAEDGKLGPGTLKAYRAYMLTANFAGRSTERNVRTLLKLMNGLQCARYAEICEANTGQEVYFYGWMNRV